jgi:prepilin signal peptidase PulO-like enzyme (type II secretory pathway)
MLINAFIVVLSTILCLFFTQKLYNRLIVNYPVYASDIPNSFICISGALLNLILQYKLLMKINIENFTNLNIFNQMLFVVSIFSIIIITMCLSISSFVDIEFYELPDELTLLVGIFLVPLSIYLHDGISIITGIILFLIFFMAALLTDNLGMGDVKLVLALGLGIKLSYLIQFMFIAFLGLTLFGAIRALIFKKSLKEEVPFGPFLIASFIILF